MLASCTGWEINALSNLAPSTRAQAGAGASATGAAGGNNTLTLQSNKPRTLASLAPPDCILVRRWRPIRACLTRCPHSAQYDVHPARIRRARQTRFWITVMIPGTHRLTFFRSAAQSTAGSMQILLLSCAWLPVSEWTVQGGPYQLITYARCK